MITCLAISDSGPEATDRFMIYASDYASAEEAQKDVKDAGSDEKIIAVIQLDLKDAGVAALAAVLQLAIEAPVGYECNIPAEELFTRVFIAGRNSVQQG